MEITWELIFTDRVTITPRATLGDGTEVTDYANSMVMEVEGTSGEHSAVRGQVVGFARPIKRQLPIMCHGLLLVLLSRHLFNH